MANERGLTLFDKSVLKAPSHIELTKHWNKIRNFSFVKILGKNSWSNAFQVPWNKIAKIVSSILGKNLVQKSCQDLDKNSNL